MTLHPYGIQNDESDYRIHVSFGMMAVYVFPTQNGRYAAEFGNGKPFEATQPGVSGITGKGVKVPWKDIMGCREIKIPQDTYQECFPEYSASPKKEDDPSSKGRAAVFLAMEMLARGQITLPTVVNEIAREDMQLKGTDLVVTQAAKIQVKCDWWGGKWGLALQTAERNPLARH